MHTSHGLTCIKYAEARGTNRPLGRVDGGAARTDSHEAVLVIALGIVDGDRLAVGRDHAPVSEAISPGNAVISAGESVTLNVVTLVAIVVLALQGGGGARVRRGQIYPHPPIPPRCLHSPFFTTKAPPLTLLHHQGTSTHPPLPPRHLHSPSFTTKAQSLTLLHHQGHKDVAGGTDLPPTPTPPSQGCEGEAGFCLPSPQPPPTR